MLFNQQQCFIYSTARFLSKLRAIKGRKTVTRHKTASTNDGLLEISKMKYWIPEPGRKTISGFADSKKKEKLMSTDPRFFLHVTVNTHIFFFWPYSDLDWGK